MNKVVLQVHRSRKKGMLTLRHLHSVRVSIVHISSRGDALVNDGKKAMMIPSESVMIDTLEESVAARQRFQFVKSIYETIKKGDIVDTAAVYFEVQKWLL